MSCDDGYFVTYSRTLSAGYLVAGSGSCPEHTYWPGCVEVTLVFLGEAGFGKRRCEGKEERQEK